MFNPPDIIEAVATIYLAQQEKYPSLKIRTISTAYTDTVKFIFSSAVLNRYSAPPPRANKAVTVDETAINLAMSVITNFDEFTYKQLPLILQQFVWFCSDSSNLPASKNFIVVSLNTYSYDEVLNILRKSGHTVDVVTNEATAYNLCPMCGINKLPKSGDVCSECYSKLLSVLNFRTESFKLYGIAMHNFTTQVRNFRIDVVDKLFAFTAVATTTEQYQPNLPFEEYRNDTAIV